MFVVLDISFDNDMHYIELHSILCYNVMVWFQVYYFMVSLNHQTFFASWLLFLLIFSYINALASFKQWPTITQYKLIPNWTRFIALSWQYLHNFTAFVYGYKRGLRWLYAMHFSFSLFLNKYNSIDSLMKYIGFKTEIRRTSMRLERCTNCHSIFSTINSLNLPIFRLHILSKILDLSKKSTQQIYNISKWNFICPEFG